ncbi:hypothetical protein DQ04_14281000, partial [Trypanosoma grayi]|uniref:hypothetical protein n=1 Tax=Trypanosoma grayi TaxID=71804 RepID=UPI0004F3FA0F
TTDGAAGTILHRTDGPQLLCHGLHLRLFLVPKRPPRIFGRAPACPLATSTSNASPLSPPLAPRFGASRASERSASQMWLTSIAPTARGKNVVAASSEHQQRLRRATRRLTPTRVAKSK